MTITQRRWLPSETYARGPNGRTITVVMRRVRDAYVFEPQGRRVKLRTLPYNSRPAGGI
jgi:hypothetical protein